MHYRLKAGLIHFGLSALVVLVAAFVVYGIWYRAPLHIALGVTNIFLVLVFVDVIIGPLLTMVVYQPGKKSLKFDLVCIALLQLAAFSYGISVLAQGRPAWVVYNVDRFDLVQAHEIDTRKVDQAASEYRTPPWFGPAWVFAMQPEEGEERRAILFESLLSGVDIHQHPELYRPLSLAAETMRARAHPLAELKRYNSDQKVEEVLHRWPSADAFLPLMAKAQPMVVLINKSSGEVLAVVELNPWGE